MRTRQKDSDFFTDTISFRQKIKASPSEIMKDLLQINDSIQLSRKYSNPEQDPRKPPKNQSSQRPRKSKTRITEDISPILGLASLINEMDSAPQVIPEKKMKTCKSVAAVTKKPGKINKNKTFMKLSGFTRAETHLGIARFISERLKRN